MEMETSDGTGTSLPPSPVSAAKVNGDAEMDAASSMNESEEEETSNKSSITPESSSSSSMAVNGVASSDKATTNLDKHGSTNTNAEYSDSKESLGTGEGDMRDAEDSEDKDSPGKDRDTRDAEDSESKDSTGKDGGDTSNDEDYKGTESPGKGENDSDSKDKGDSMHSEEEEVANDAAAEQVEKDSLSKENSSDEMELDTLDDKEIENDKETEETAGDKAKSKDSEESSKGMEERDDEDEAEKVDPDSSEHSIEPDKEKVTPRSPGTEKEEHSTPSGEEPEKDKQSKSEPEEANDKTKQETIEIPDTPEKSTSNPGQAEVRPTILVSTPGAIGASLVLDGITATGLPRMSVPSSGIVVPQTSGIQLMLPTSLMYMPGSSHSLLTSTSTPSTLFLPGLQSSQLLARNSAPMTFPQYTSMLNNPPNRLQHMPPHFLGSKQAPTLTPMPEKPTSSMGMIDMIRWETTNHINIRPKYVKPNPKAELGNLSKWLFDLGADQVKEFVYHDLVRIQLKRKDEGNLSTKEKEDFAKLQDIDKDMNKKVGHLKFKLNKRCRKCNFRADLKSVLYGHTSQAHLERGGFLVCALCKYSTRQPSQFKLHMEAEHGRVGKIDNRASFYECPLCPYESNYTNRLEQHKTRCLKVFRESFNLHPSCITGPEVNLCLENVFYYVFTRQFMNSIMPALPPQTTSSKQMLRDKISPKPGPSHTTVQLQAKKAGHAITTSTASTKFTPRGTGFGQRTITPEESRKHIEQVLAQSNISRNYPVITSKIVKAPTPGPTYTFPGPRQMNAAGMLQQPQVAGKMGIHPVAPTAPGQANGSFEVCEICGGYVKDRKALRIHFFYAHRIDMPFGVFERPQAPLYCATCFARFWTAQGLQKHIEVHKNALKTTSQQGNGVAGTCISCGHRVNNILMHMRLVHNRELRHYMAALMCIFCGKRCATKKEVELHMGKAHGVIVQNLNLDDQPANSKASPSASAPKNAKGKSGGGSQCVLCNLTFARNVELTRHCMRVHHTCMKCGLVVVDKESLTRHTCLHSASGMRTCQICHESGFHPAYYIKHMRDKHLTKCSVVLRRIDRAVVDTLKRPIMISDSEEEVVDSDSNSSAPKKPKLEAKDPHHDTLQRGSRSGKKYRSSTANEARAEKKAQDEEEKQTVEQESSNEPPTAERTDAEQAEYSPSKGPECSKEEGHMEEESNLKGDDVKKEPINDSDDGEKGNAKKEPINDNEDHAKGESKKEPISDNEDREKDDDAKKDPISDNEDREKDDIKKEPVSDTEDNEKDEVQKEDGSGIEDCNCKKDEIKKEDNSGTEDTMKDELKKKDISDTEDKSESNQDDVEQGNEVKDEERKEKVVKEEHPIENGDIGAHEGERDSGSCASLADSPPHRKLRSRKSEEDNGDNSRKRKIDSVDSAGGEEVPARKSLRSSTKGVE